MKTIGIDEAGRGPVIGPMVMCGVILDEKNAKELTSLGVKDSKLILPHKREELSKKIKNLCIDYELLKINPTKIDKILNSSDSNLNWLEADITAKIINELLKRQEDIKIIYVDCPSNNIERYKEYLNKRIKKFSGKLIVEHKADAKYISASAASILAKVSRDKEIEKLKKELNIDFGSGYPSDPKTINFLKNNWDNKKFSNIFRKSWASWKKYSKNEKQMKLV